MSNRNFDSSALIKRLADKAISKNIFSSCNIQPQTSNLSASVINQVNLGNSLSVSRGPACTTIDYGCPCQATNIIQEFQVNNPSGMAEWAAYFDTTNPDQGKSIITDSNNNVYMTGFYTSSTIQNIRNASLYNYNPSGITLPATDGEATFLIKYSPTGIVQWAISLNGSGNDKGLSVDVDSSNNIYLTGFYTSPTSIYVQDVSGNSQIPSSISLPASYTPPDTAIPNAFLIKYTSSGISQWATYLNSSGDDQGRHVKIDSSNNVYVTGYYTSPSPVTVQDVSGNSQTPSAIILPTSYTPPDAATSNAFLIRYTSSGISQWATYLDSSGNDNGTGIAFDSSNNVYLTGIYNSPTLLYVKNSSTDGYSNSLIQIEGGSNNGYFIIKYDSSGLVQWVTCQRSSFSFGGIITNLIAIDTNNDLYVVGVYNGTPNYNIKNAITSGSTYPNSGLQFRSSGGSIFLVKYNSSGIVQWGVVVDSANTDSGNSVVIDSLNNVYITGSYDAPSSPVTLNNGYLGPPESAIPSLVKLPITTPSGLTQAVFLIKYDSSGLVQWANYLNSSQNDSGQNVTVDSLNNVYLTGYYRGSSTTVWNSSTGTVYEPSGITLPATLGSDVAFLIKYT
jgi:hypothetical protein